jgi:hypothetical protein
MPFACSPGRTFSSLGPSQCFHTVITTQVIEPQWPTECSLHMFFALPPHIFVDPYELASRQPAYTSIILGNANLELPIAAVPQADSGILLNISLPARSAADMNVTIDVPLHCRYGEPKLVAHRQDFGIDPPVVLWACPRVCTSVVCVHKATVAAKLIVVTQPHSHQNAVSSLTISPHYFAPHAPLPEYGQNLRRR